LKSKFFGVVEGFYRRPYSFEERRDLIIFSAEIGLNTYVYGPKADPFHRKKYDRLYPRSLRREFKELNKLCKKHSVRFNYALSPLTRPDTGKIIRKISSMLDCGITDFSLFYDDIEVSLTEETAERQIETANELLNFLESKISEPQLFFCPTQYRGFKKTEYISTIARKLHPRIHIFWTGKKVVAKRITAKDINRITEIIGRPPLIWDNIFANDYIPETILKFPYRYRESEIVKRVDGILINPMNQYQESKPLLYTAAKFFHNPFNYVPAKAWKEAKKLFPLKE